MRIILAAADAVAGKALQSSVRAAGWRESETASSAEALARALAASGAGTGWVIAGPGLAAAKVFLPVALAHRVPITIWPAEDAAGVAPQANEPGTAAPAQPAPRLTSREREILALLAGGVSNKGIARALRVSPNTVKFHLRALYAKLGAATRAEAVAVGVRCGELTL